MDDEAENLKAAFGDSSDDDDLADRPEKETLGIRYSTVWERVEEINGLWLCRNFLSIAHQSDLLSAILNEGWFVEESINQAMRFGDLPSWATKLSDIIRETVEYADVSVLPADLLWREPLFDQLIVNLYQPGEGICAHVDLLRFEDGIAIVSLESPCVMRFSPTEKEEDEDVDVLLSPGSLILMSGEARYQWKHEINRKQKGFQVWEGEEIDQKRRISITLRKLCQA
ncbi:Alkylated DNA repair -like protein ALKBH8 [Cardamine amara subsp. amara]|uniref:Alkylated DNA repair -like protein ALKBH8 n=1 Tax=Cardamine amara subsp. amara TaxID=228776 RepID=A0ABD1C6N6_CARAN